jgi:hypothetical protein
MTKLISRKYQAGDETGIVSLYNQITGRKRTLDQHRWEWLYTPEGIGSIWVIIDSKSGEIVGHHGLIPLALDVFGERLLTGKTENTILKNKYLGTGIYFLHEKRFHQQAKAKFDLLLSNIVTGTPRKIRHKLGYKSVGTYENYLLITNRNALKKNLHYLIEKKLSGIWVKLIPQAILSTIGYSVLPGIKTKRIMAKNLSFHVIEDIAHVENDLNALWKQLKGKLGITIERSASFLKWRIFDNPHVSYTFLLAKKGPTTVGYIITKISKKHRHQGIIEDLVCDPDNTGVFNALISKAVENLNQSGMDIVSFPTLDSNNSFNTNIRQYGFIPLYRWLHHLQRFMRKSQEKYELLIKVSSEGVDSEKIYDPSNWYYTRLFKEGI